MVRKSIDSLMFRSHRWSIANDAKFGLEPINAAIFPSARGTCNHPISRSSMMLMMFQMASKCTVDFNRHFCEPSRASAQVLAVLWRPQDSRKCSLPVIHWELQLRPWIYWCWKWLSVKMSVWKPGYLDFQEVEIKILLISSIAWLASSSTPRKCLRVCNSSACPSYS